MPIHLSNDTLWNLLQAEENDELEFKSSSLLTEPDQSSRRKIAREMVAFANHKGGKIVFGVDDDGNIEGADLSEEMCLSTISEIIEGYCSPTPKIEHNFYSESQDDLSSGSVLVLEVLEQVGAPPIAVVDYSDGRIKRREYRIRSGESTRYVSNSELIALFTDSPDEQIKNKYPVTYTVTTDLEPISIDNKPNYFLDIDDILTTISENTDDLKSNLKRERQMDSDEATNTDFFTLYTGIITMSVLREFYRRPIAYSDEILRGDSGEDRFESLNIENQTVDDLEHGDPDTNLGLLSVTDVSLSDIIHADGVKYFIDDYEPGFQVPEESTIAINDGLNGFKIASPEMFTISVEVSPTEGAIGFPYEHPKSTVKGNRNMRNYEDADDSVWTSRGTVEVSIDFEYPVQSYSDYNESKEYFEKYIDPIIGTHDWEGFVSGLPDKKLQVIEAKLDEVKEKLSE